MSNGRCGRSHVRVLSLTAARDCRPPVRHARFLWRDAILCVRNRGGFASTSNNIKLYSKRYKKHTPACAAQAKSDSPVTFLTHTRTLRCNSIVLNPHRIQESQKEEALRKKKQNCGTVISPFPNVPRSSTSLTMRLQRVLQPPRRTAGMTR